MENISKEIKRKLQITLRDKSLFVLYSLYSTDSSSLHKNILRDVCAHLLSKITVETRNIILLKLGWRNGIHDSMNQNLIK